jgi:hypothetical protein
VKREPRSTVHLCMATPDDLAAVVVLLDAALPWLAGYSNLSATDKVRTARAMLELRMKLARHT